MIAFIGSVFSPYYHWSGRKMPENHVAFNVALYGPQGHAWAMTERSAGHLKRNSSALTIGSSTMRFDGSELAIAFDEVFLPWPGQRFLPKRMRGEIRLAPDFLGQRAYSIDEAGGHVWQPVAPSGRVNISCDSCPGGGWSGDGYHDMNFGARPLEADFAGWDWARGTTRDGRTVVLYDSLLASGTNHRFGLVYAADGAVCTFQPPAGQPLKRGFWGVGGGIACDDAVEPILRNRFEDTPFYRRSLVETAIFGDRVRMVHETLDCRRLAMPLVRLMLPFRMPRKG
ncbi:carotenoid 1,2-hydratase [Rhizobium sp. AG855]|uniref:carotenoid 1,2-hydratase n=1 Tax=Rhizobium sp. AG855 TaxID=2183898 RepID=UPI000E70895B|nr:carotenoid 1,2-hydratase [Rhizobium sp. AG855]RKE79517.1 hydroxyneurosporene synthase [Rhizobium sp. AG855]